MSYAYVFYDNYIFRFDPEHMMFRKKTMPIDSFMDLPGHHKNGDPFTFNEMRIDPNNWNQMTAQYRWLAYLQGDNQKILNQERFKEFYKLFEKDGNMKHYIFFYTDNFTYRMSKGIIEVYNKDTDKWGEVISYADHDDKSLVGCNIINHNDFIDGAYDELMDFIKNENTNLRFLEFLDVIKKGVDVKDDN